MVNSILHTFKFYPNPKEHAVVRVFNIGDEPWFVVEDVAKVLGHKYPFITLLAYKKFRVVDGQVVITLQGVYTLILDSLLPVDVPERFRDWVDGIVSSYFPKMTKQKETPIMDNALSTFLFPVNSNVGAPVRVVNVNGEPWFVAKDVAAVLGYAEAGLAVRTHCKGGVKRTLPTAGGVQSMTIIPERDVYRLIMRSKLPAAEAFEEWVVGTVLPAIRKDGAYVVGEEKVATGEIDEDELVLKAVSILQCKVERLRKEKARLAAEKKVIKAELRAADQEIDRMGSVIGAHLHTVARFARTIPGVNINATKGDLLRAGYLYRAAGTNVYRV